MITLPEINFTLLKNTAYAIVSGYRAIRSKPVVKELCNSSNPVVARVGKGLHEGLYGNASQSAVAGLTQIEDRRRALLNTRETIKVIDYGAGSSYEQRTEEQMKQGVQKTAAISNICKASKPARWAALLHHIVLCCEPKSAVELGSCVGISGSYIASAMKNNGKGSLTTLEGSPEIARIATETFSTLGLANAKVVAGAFHSTLSNVLEASKPIDFFFNDGHHDRDAVLRYFEQSLPYLSPNAVVAVDDITWSTGMKSAWKTLRERKQVAASVDLGKMGILIMGEPVPGKSQFDMPL